MSCILESTKYIGPKIEFTAKMDYVKVSSRITGQGVLLVVWYIIYIKNVKPDISFYITCSTKLNRWFLPEVVFDEC